jgi:zinc protease
LALLAGAQADPRRLEIIRTTIPDLQAVTVQDVQKAADTWLDPKHAYKIIVTPPPP